VHGRCVENVIRATETVRQLEARLTTTQAERDEARQRLRELEQQRAPAAAATNDDDDDADDGGGDDAVIRCRKQYQQRDTSNSAALSGI